MNDRFMNGLLAGTIGGIAAGASDILLVDILKLGSLRFADFAAILLLGTKPDTFVEYVFGKIGHVGFSAGLGVIFAYLVQLISSNYLYIKGVFFGLATWFFVYAVTLLFRVPGLTSISINSAVVDYVGSAIYGLVLAYALQRLEKREHRR